MCVCVSLILEPRTLGQAARNLLTHQLATATDGNQVATTFNNNNNFEKL